MAERQSEVDKFFDGLPSEETKDVDIFAKDEAAPAKAENEGAASPEGGEPRKNRRHRRLEQQLQTEREARIAAEARAEGREAAEGSRPQPQTDVPAEWLRIYGDTPEAKSAWALNKSLWSEEAKKVREETLAEVDSRETRRKEAQQGFETLIEGELEGIEDEHDVDLTSDAPAARKARREFLELVSELSPKDNAGQVTAYADFSAAWKQYAKGKAEAAKDPDAERRREIASRSMGANAGTEGAPQKRTPGFFGWERDMK